MGKMNRTDATCREEGTTCMKPMKILKGAATVVGSVVLVGALAAAAMFAFSSSVSPIVVRSKHD